MHYAWPHAMIITGLIARASKYISRFMWWLCHLNNKVAKKEPQKWQNCD